MEVMEGNNTYHNSPYKIQDPFSFLSVKVVFIMLYSAVTITCLVGNSLVLYVLVVCRKMHNITNFFLANLAIADLCVGLFCIMQTLITPHLQQHWPFGEVMCTMLYFVQCVSYTASILILTVISVERYLVILHPLASRTLIIRRWRIRLVGVLVWILAAAYASPMIFNSYIVSINIPEFSKIGNITVMRNTTFQYCLDSTLIDIKRFVLVNIVLMYALPLLLMLFIYSKICRMLWNSGKLRVDSKTISGRSFRLTRLNTRLGSKDSQSTVTSPDTSGVLRNGHERFPLRCGKQDRSHMFDGARKYDKRHDEACDTQSNTGIGEATKSEISQGRLTSEEESTGNMNSRRSVHASRRKVIRLLIVLILAFAICVLPHHICQLAHHWSPNPIPSTGDLLLLPLTQLMLYLNSCLNPVLYALLSENFRNAYREIGSCCRRRV